VRAARASGNPRCGDHRRGDRGGAALRQRRVAGVRERRPRPHRAGPRRQTARRAPGMRRSIGLLILALAACGYHLPGRGAGVPDTAHSISVKLFANRTREHGLEVGLRRAIEEEFRRRGPLTIAPEGEGDLVLSGIIRRFWTTPVTFIGTSEAVQYQGVLQIA